MKHLTKTHFLLPLSLLIIDSLVFGLTDPNKVPSFMLIVAFLLVAATLYCVTRVFIRVSRIYGFKVSHPRRLALILTSISGGLIALQSMGELTGRDMLVLLPLIVLSYLYVSYGRNSRDQPAS
jgi:hypothetical protein